MSTPSFNAVSGSQPSEPSDLTPSGSAPITSSSAMDNTAPSAAILAQTVDRLAQDYGLSNESRQKLFLFAFQSHPTPDVLRIFAFMLQNSEALRGVTTAIATLSSQLQTLTSLTRRDWQMSPTQESSIRAMIKNHIISARTSYEDLNERSKSYVSGLPGQFAMTAYTTDNTVRSIVNRYIDSESHQVRGAFRKVIFTTVARSSTPGPIESLQTIATGLVRTYSTQYTNAPVWIQAHVAQLRLIAVDIMCAMPIPPPVEGSSSSSTARVKRPKRDTGFWVKVNTVFSDLVQQYGSDYEAGSRWREWEQSVIAEHAARIQSAANLIPAEIVRSFISASSF